MSDTQDFNYQTLEEALAATVYFVESPCSFVRCALWFQHSYKATECGYPKLKWQQVSRGFWQHVNGVNSTCVSFHFDYICDQLVCFYEPTSQKVDWGEVDKFLEPYWTQPDGSRRKCNAQNFHHCGGYLRDGK
jgi:hypothetical protein